MSFDDVMATMFGWMVATEAFAALGAELALKQSGAPAPPEIVAALHDVSAAAGLADLDDLAPAQQAVLVGLVRTYIRQAADLLDEPAREAGWTFTDPDILDGWGRGSAMVPTVLSSAPELNAVESFLDVGTGVGLLAVAAASVWPAATIVGIDTWARSLERAHTNVAHAGLEDRISLRQQDVADLDDIDRFDCAWVPTFFLTEPALAEALPKVLRAVRPGGWIVLGLFVSPPDPLADATMRLRTIRGGGSVVAAPRAVELLEQAGCGSVHMLPRLGPIPMEFSLGQRSAA